MLLPGCPLPRQWPRAGCLMTALHASVPSDSSASTGTGSFSPQASGSPGTNGLATTATPSLGPLGRSLRPSVSPWSFWPAATPVLTGRSTAAAAVSVAQLGRGAGRLQGQGGPHAMVPWSSRSRGVLVLLREETTEKGEGSLAAPSLRGSEFARSFLRSVGKVGMGTGQELQDGLGGKA